MSKPWDENWREMNHTVTTGPDGGWSLRLTADTWDGDEAAWARARLAAAAPDLVRALLAVEWSAMVGTPPEAKGCVSCHGVHPDFATAACVERQYGFLRQQVPVGHTVDCTLAAALRKAGVIE